MPSLCHTLSPRPDERFPQRRKDAKALPSSWLRHERRASLGLFLSLRLCAFAGNYPIENEQCEKDHYRILLLFLCRSTIRRGVAKKSNSSRSRFCKCLSYEKCNPALPPAVKTTNVGGRTPTCVMYCTCKRDTPPFTGAGVAPPRGCAISRSKNSLSCDVRMRRLRASFARPASGRILLTRWPSKAEIVITGAHSRNFIRSRSIRSNSFAVFVSLSLSKSHLFTTMMIEQ